MGVTDEPQDQESYVDVPDEVMDENFQDAAVSGRKTRKSGGKSTKRVTATVPEKLYHELYYWSDSDGVSVNTLLAEAVQYYIDFRNGNYHTDDMLINRINQVVDAVCSMQSTLGSVGKNVMGALDSLTSLARGDNYLAGEETGEL